MARSKIPIARVGNYAAPVDTAGIDPEMKVVMGMAHPDEPTAAVRRKGKQTPFDWLKKMLGVK